MGKSSRTEPNADKIECWGNFSKLSSRCQKCELSAPCKSKTDEPKENMKYQFQHLSVNQFWCNGEDDNGIFNNETFTAKEYFDCIDRADSPPENLVLKDLVIPEDVKPVIFEIVHRLAEFYFHTPHVFEAIMKNAFQGKSQSDIAREKHITRQCENKRLLRDLGIAQKRNDIQTRRDRELAEAKQEYADKTDELRKKDTFLSSLSERQWLVYKLHFVDGCSEISTANQIGCSRRTVARVAQFLRENLSKNGTIIKRGRKKNAKKNKNAPDGGNRHP